MWSEPKDPEPEPIFCSYFVVLAYNQNANKKRDATLINGAIISTRVTNKYLLRTRGHPELLESRGCRLLNGDAASL